jgi:cell division protein FtsQ
VETRPARPSRRSAAAPARSVAGRPRVDVSRFVPSTRSVLAGFALLLGGMIAFAVARQSSLFAIRSIEVVGAKPALERQVRDALQPLVGTSLVALDGGQVQKRLDALPQIRRASYDRAFPNTLRVVVEPDLPAAILRSGADGWLISEYGAVLGKLSRPFPKNLPGIWIPQTDAPTPRTHDVPARITVALRGLAEARRTQSALLPQISKVKAVAGDLTLVLRSHIELRMGDARDLALKLAVANRVLQTLSADERKRIRYVDLTLPSRPVTGRNPQL